jgi:hypothetical protein
MESIWPWTLKVQYFFISLSAICNSTILSEVARRLFWIWEMTQRGNLSAQGALNLKSNCYNLLQMVWLQILALKVGLYNLCTELAFYWKTINPYCARIEWKNKGQFKDSLLRNMWSHKCKISGKLPTTRWEIIIQYSAVIFSTFVKRCTAPRHKQKTQNYQIYTRPPNTLTSAKSNCTLSTVQDADWGNVYWVEAGKLRIPISTWMQRMDILSFNLRCS